VAASISVPVLHGTTPETTSLPGLVWAEAAAHAAAATAAVRRRTAALGAIAALRKLDRSWNVARAMVLALRACLRLLARLLVAAPEIQRHLIYMLGIDPMSRLREREYFKHLYWANLILYLGLAHFRCNC